jgi:hypothetical protein
MNAGTITRLAEVAVGMKALLPADGVEASKG